MLLFSIKHLSFCICASFAFGFKAEMWDLILIISDHYVFTSLDDITT